MPIALDMRRRGHILSADRRGEIPMTRLALSMAALALSHATPAFAQSDDWVPRCRLQVADDARPESGKYFFQTRGKTPGAAARANLDYTTSVSARAAVYPTAAKDLLNPYGNVSLSLSYFTSGDGKGKPTVGAVSFRAIGKDFNAIPGAAISMKLVIDGASFGPFETSPVSSGMYSVWLDTADTDGDGKPPTLKPAEFGKLAQAIDAMKSVDVVLVREGVDLVSASLPFPNLAAWRDGLTGWAARTTPSSATGAPSCGAGDVLN
jgi:hypothetical protein